jgi:uncharacterized membrane protein YozB (DUF420 family)
MGSAAGRRRYDERVISKNIRSAGPRSGLACIAILAALGLLATIAIGSVIGITQIGQHRPSLWHAAKLLASMVTWLQWLELFSWAVVTGVLVAAGTYRHRFGLLLALGAVLAGALVPVGLITLATALVRIWPGTTGPMDEPVLTLILLAYSLVVPWTLGRIITFVPCRLSSRDGRAHRSANQKAAGGTHTT